MFKFITINLLSLTVAFSGALSAQNDIPISSANAALKKAAEFESNIAHLKNQMQEFIRFTEAEEKKRDGLLSEQLEKIRRMRALFNFAPLENLDMKKNFDQFFVLAGTAKMKQDTVDVLTEAITPNMESSTLYAVSLKSFIEDCSPSFILKNWNEFQAFLNDAAMINNFWAPSFVYASLEAAGQPENAFSIKLRDCRSATLAAYETLTKTLNDTRNSPLYRRQSVDFAVKSLAIGAVIMLGAYVAYKAYAWYSAAPVLDPRVQAIQEQAALIKGKAGKARAPAKVRKPRAVVAFEQTEPAPLTGLEIRHNQNFAMLVRLKEDVKAGKEGWKETYNTVDSQYRKNSLALSDAGQALWKDVDNLAQHNWRK